MRPRSTRRSGSRWPSAEFRGYGQSEGEPTLRTVVDDARTVAASIDGRVIVMGRSLGGMAVHGLYAKPVAGMIGVVLESALSDLRGLIRRRGMKAPDTFSDDELALYDPTTKLGVARFRCWFCTARTTC